MIANVKGKEVKVFNSNGMFVRTIHCSSDVASAYVSGDEVNIQLANGHSEIYKTNGLFVRRF